MSKKKHIDELFKEQLQNFEAAPSPDVWNNIQTKMKKEKEDRKVIPIWWTLGGVAALLVLLLALNFVFQPFAGDAPVEIVTEDPSDTQILDDKTSPIIDDEMNTEAITSEETVDESLLDEIEDGVKDEKPKDATSEKILQKSEKEQNAIAVDVDPKTQNLKTTDAVETQVDKIKKFDPKDEIGIDDAVTDVSEEEKKTTKKDKVDRDPLIKEKVEGEAKKGVIGVAKILDKKDDPVAKKEEAIAITEKKSDPELKKDTEVQTDVKTFEDAVAVEDKVEEKKEKDIPEEKKKSIFDAIEENKEDAVAIKEERDGRNWEVTPNFGPVYYNSIDGGSAIDPSFADNSQSGEVNFSYGVQVSYAINDRLSIRSGISNVDLGYTTGDVELATGPVAIALGTIDYGAQGRVLSAFDKGTLNNLPPPSGENDPFARLNPKSTSGNAEIIQNLSYFEVPMELKYALLNKRFGLNMIGGFSTLFLGNNEVSVRDGDFRDVLGPANNLNQVSFSTNFGLGLDYKISNRLKFNVEPMFKYQLNPYTDSSVDFRPYYFGVYSGLSFKF